jgi:hypothetical protein
VPTMSSELGHTMTISVTWTFSSTALAAKSRLSIKSLSPANERERPARRADITPEHGPRVAAGDTAHE